jgi:glycerol-3-phosphate acyltransferase PlsY
MKYILLTIISYFIGNISFAYILGKIFAKKDVREYGSGNAGATNAFRTFGKKVGALVFLGDVLKGVAAVLLGRYLGGQTGAYIAGAFVIIGHNWPVLLSFKGGKGVATTIGVMLFVNLCNLLRMSRLRSKVHPPALFPILPLYCFLTP